jgi:hypothetical protein
MVDARNYNRYRLEIPVTYSWMSAQRTQQQGVGMTRDLSVRGAYIFATDPPPLNASIGLKALLPPGSAALPLQMFGQGEVVRIEPAVEGHDRGFAVAARPFVVRRGEG